MPFLILLGLGATVALVALSRSKAIACSDENLRKMTLISHAALRDLINGTNLVPLSAKLEGAKLIKRCGKAAIRDFGNRNPAIRAESKRLLLEFAKKRGIAPPPVIAPSPGIALPSVV